MTIFGVERPELQFEQPCNRPHSVVELGHEIHKLSQGLATIDPTRPTFIQELTQLFAQQLDVDVYVGFAGSQASRSQAFRKELKDNPKFRILVDTVAREYSPGTWGGADNFSKVSSNATACTNNL